MAQVPLNSISTIQSYGPRPSSMPSLPNAAGRAVAAGARVYDTAISIEQDKLRRRLGDINDKYKRRAEAINGIVKGINIAVDGYTNAVRIEERRANREAEEALNELSRRMNRQFYGYVDEETGSVHKGIKDMPFTEMSNGEFGQKANNPVLATIRAYKDFADSDYYKSMSQNGQKAFQRGVNATMASYLKEAEQLTIAGLQKQKEYIRAQKAQNAANEIKAASSFINVESGIYDQRLYDNLYLMVYSPYEQNGQIKLKRDENGNAILDPEHIEFVGSEEFQEATRQELDADVKKYFHVMNGVMFDNVANEYVNTDDDAKAQRIEAFLWDFVLSGTTVSNKKEVKTVDGQDVEVTVSGCDATELSAWVAGGKDTAWYSAKQVELGVKRLNGLQEERRSRMEKEDESNLQKANMAAMDLLLSNGESNRDETFKTIGSIVGGLKLKTPAQKAEIEKGFRIQLKSDDITRAIRLLDSPDAHSRHELMGLMSDDDIREGVSMMLESQGKRPTKNASAQSAPVKKKKQLPDKFVEEIVFRTSFLGAPGTGTPFAETFQRLQNIALGKDDEYYCTSLQYGRQAEALRNFAMYSKASDNNAVLMQQDNMEIQSAFKNLTGIDLSSVFEWNETSHTPILDEDGNPVLRGGVSDTVDAFRLAPETPLRMSIGGYRYDVGTRRKKIKYNVPVDALFNLYQTCQKYYALKRLKPDDEMYSKTLEQYLREGGRDVVDALAGETQMLQIGEIDSLFDKGIFLLPEE